MGALRELLTQRAGVLAESWRGEGASAFRSEMEGELLPALQRLTEALNEAARTTEAVSAILRQGEEEAAALFRGQANGEAGGFAGLWEDIGEWVHGGLDVLGLVPAFGEVADGINGLIYLAEGRHVEAGISFAAMIPIVGWGAVASKVGLRVVREGAELGAERALREAAAESGWRRAIVEAAADRAEPLLRAVLERTARMGNRDYAELAELIAKGGDENLAIISERIGTRFEYDYSLIAGDGVANWNSTVIKLSPHGTALERVQGLFHELVHFDLTPRGFLAEPRQIARIGAQVLFHSHRWGEEVIAESIAQLRTGGRFIYGLDHPFNGRYSISRNRVLVEGGILFGGAAGLGYRIGISIRGDEEE